MICVIYFKQPFQIQTAACVMIRVLYYHWAGKIDKLEHTSCSLAVTHEYDLYTCVPTADSYKSVVGIYNSI